MTFSPRLVAIHDASCEHDIKLPRNLHITSDTSYLLPREFSRRRQIGKGF
jgi:hypothetical protein